MTAIFWFVIIFFMFVGLFLYLFYKVVDAGSLYLVTKMNLDPIVVIGWIVLFVFLCFFVGVLYGVFSLIKNIRKEAKKYMNK